MLARFTITFCLLCALALSLDPYKTLKLTKQATQKEIKKAYRKLSLQFHPDKNKDPGASEKFSEISRSYEILSDEEKRSTYDRYGEEGLKQQEGRGGGGGGGDPFASMFEQFGFNMGGGNQRRGGNNQEQRTEDVEMPIYMTLKQLYLGEVFDVAYKREVLCMNWKECTKKSQNCQGAGIAVRTQQLAPGFVQQVQVRDDKCISRGQMWRSNCRDCPNGKTETEETTLTVDVNKGMRNGEIITFENVADEKVGYTAGDLVMVIRETKHEFFTRDGDNLYATMEIPLVDALVGFKDTLEHLDGHIVKIEVAGVTECEDIIKIQGEGMPRAGGRGFGDLFITFEVDFPESLSESQKKSIREILKGTESKNSKKGENGDEL